MLSRRMPRPSPRAAISRGLGIVELLVGLALGLFVVSGALMLLAGSMGENRRMLVETRLVQDLRATSDMVTRDLRRAGYWNAAHTGVWYLGGPNVPPQNPYSRLADSACSNPSALTLTSTTASTQALCYAIQAAGDANTTIDAPELFGFELDSGVLYSVVSGGGRQALSDPKAITITDLVITPSSQVLNASSYCRKPCTGASCPQVVVREYEVLIQGNAPGDTAVSRFLRSNVRIRNDHYGGQCPT